MLYHRCAFCTNPALIAPTMIKVSFINSLIYILVCMQATQCRSVLVSACVALYFSYIATRVCKFLHACVAPYTRVHESKISTRVFCVCCVRVTRVSHACGLRVTRVGHACHTRGSFKLWVICTVYSSSYRVV